VKRLTIIAATLLLAGLVHAQWTTGVWSSTGGSGIDQQARDSATHALEVARDSVGAPYDSASVAGNAHLLQTKDTTNLPYAVVSDSGRVAVTAHGFAGTNFESDTVTADVFQITGGYSLPYEPYRATVMSNNAASLTPDIDTYKQLGDSAIAQDVTINAPTGTPVYGQKLLIHLVAAGTDRNLTWNGTFVTGAYAVPDSIHASKKLYVGFAYNGAAWDCIANKEQP